MIENQEHYLRRLNNVPVPVDGNGKILHPVNIDEIILDICHGKLETIHLEDFGRSHCDHW